MYKADPSFERRKFHRYKLSLNAFYKIDLPVYVKLWYGDEEFEASTLDISRGGLALVTKLDLPISCIISMKLMLFKLDREGGLDYFSPGIVSGEVKSKTPAPGAEYRLGVSFVHSDDAIVSEINNFIQSSQ